LRYVSLFTGSGGFDIGLHQAGEFECLLMNEIDRDAVKTLRHNLPNQTIHPHSVETLTLSTFAEYGILPGSVDLVVGGPPCQAFSTTGARKGLEDNRGNLLFEFLRVVSDLKPDFFIMENVKGLLSSKTLDESPRNVVDVLYELFEAEGYRVQGFLLNSLNYGAPQSRERVILLGNRKGLVASRPEPTHGLLGIPYKTLRDAIHVQSGFQDPDRSIMDFSARKKSILAHVPAGGMWRDLPADVLADAMKGAWNQTGGRSSFWRRLSWDEPSPTVVTMPNHISTPLCHPEETRALTVGECAAVQEFPPSWIFQGTTASKYRQIGNAVPPRLGFVVARVLQNMQPGDVYTRFERVHQTFRVARKKKEDEDDAPPSLF